MNKENNAPTTDKNVLNDKIKEDTPMTTLANTDRYCTIEESIIQSCKEVKEMREGKRPKNKLSDLFANIEKWAKEEE